MKPLSILAAVIAWMLAGSVAAQTWPVSEGDHVARDFRFEDGQTLSELRLHYRTLGTPRRDAEGRVTNAVMVLHGTGGSGAQFLQPQFADELYGPGQPLDISQWYIILPDGIGHGASSSPSDGLRAAFPEYTYDDMIAAQGVLLEALGVDRLRLLIGTSMGCMQGFAWAAGHPYPVDAMLLLACQPTEIAGRNRLWRAMVLDAIRSDPAWDGGNYTEQPTEGLRTASDLLILAGAAPLQMQAMLPDRATTDAWLEEQLPRRIAGLDANDLWFQVNASRDYDPSADLERIGTTITWINSADDFINPPELGLSEQFTPRIAGVRYVLIPASPETRGHGTHTWARFWKDELVFLLERSAAPPATDR